MLQKINPNRAPSRDRRPPRLDPHTPIPDALVAVRARWVATGLHAEQTLARMGETVNRFASRLLMTGSASFAGVTEGEVTSFVEARTKAGDEPELATQHARRTAVRALFRTLRALGADVGDPSLDLWLPPRGMLAARPLTDDEIALCRMSAQIGARAAATRRAVVWALGEATAVSSEITAIRLADLDDVHQPTCVRLPGTRRHDPRLGVLTDWGRRVLSGRSLSLRLRGAESSTLLAYAGAAPPGGAKAQASVCNAIREVLNLAGLGDEADVRPASLRNWAGRAAYDTGAPLEQVAAMLGCRSLDTAAEDIALDWRQVGK